METRFQIQDIESVAQQILETLTSKTILLTGNMGVGKTTFVKGLVKVLGSSDDVSSPTFSIVNEYHLQHGLLYHFDLFRIKDENEALQLGIEEYLESDQWVVIEWPEIILNLMQDDVNMIELILNEDHSRTLKLNKNINITNKYGKKLHKL